jgi:hypothetical protein
MIGGTRFESSLAASRIASSDARHLPASRAARTDLTRACCTRSLSGSTTKIGIVAASSV